MNMFVSLYWPQKRLVAVWSTPRHLVKECYIKQMVKFISLLIKCLHNNIIINVLCRLVLGGP